MSYADLDAVIIGSGMGGAFAAYTLANAGLKTLLLEKGDHVKRDASDWNPEDILIRKRYQSTVPIAVQQGAEHTPKKQYFNENVGGMSVFYGAAVFRLRENDFKYWPIDYDDLSRHYDKAEELLGVGGLADAHNFEPPRRFPYPYPPLPYNPPARRIHQAAEKLGLRPYPIPMALNHFNDRQPKCIQCNTCDGFPCKIKAKNEAETTALKHARRHNHFHMQTGIIADRLIHKNGHVHGVQCINKHSGETFTLKAKVYIISAGALQSPALLLRSAIHNNHAYTGRCLMRHANAVVGAVFPFRTNPENHYHKQVCIGDFYEAFRTEHDAACGVIQDIYTPATTVFRHFAPATAKPFAFINRFVQNLLCIAEDEPQVDNGISLGHEKDRFGMPLVKVQHRYSTADLIRRDFLVKNAKTILKTAGGLLHRTMAIETFSHAVGTLRFGNAPDSAILDRHCRVFDFNNLYTIDGSFFPTSAGVNPSLTIAANALRVAEHIVEENKR